MLVMGLVCARLFGRFHGAILGSLRAILRGPFRALESTNYRIWAAGALCIQYRHLDAAHRAGLARPHRTDAPECHLGRHRDGLQFAPQILLLPLTRLRRRPSRPAQADLLYAGGDGLAGARLGVLIVTWPGSALAGLYLRVASGLRVAPSIRRHDRPSWPNSSTNAFCECGSD